MKTMRDETEREAMDKLNYDEAMKILESTDAQRAADYRAVIAAVQRLPMVYHPGFGDLWRYVRDAYMKAAIDDATRILVNQYFERIRVADNHASDSGQ